MIHERARAVAVFSWGVSRIPHLATLCGAARLVVRPTDARAQHLDGVLVWGYKPSARAGVDYALRHRLPLWRAEDGFLRSVGLGVSGDAPLSIVLDDEGIYYDAAQPSRLERLITEGSADAAIARARRCIDRIVTADLSKYNDAPPDPVDLGPRDRPRVLVVDQTAGDISVKSGMADATSFQRMLEAARDENPDAEIVVKIHPDVLAGKKQGYLERVHGDRVRVFAERVTPYAFLRHIDRVYVVTSQLGFEALLAGLPVTCFGAPWYAGWGPTDDRVRVPRRSARRTVEALFDAAYLRYARYLDPHEDRLGDIEDVIEHLALQRSAFAENRGRHYGFGFRFWKRGYMRAYLRCPGNRLVFARSAAHAERAGLDRDSQILVWGQRETADVRALAARHDIPIVRVEDGFLRSVGLGSDLAMPASLVFDKTGIYYDPQKPSDLETILQTADFDDDELGRASALRKRIIDAGLSKYNVGGDAPLRLAHGDKTVVLVPGQVEDDASVELGCRDVRDNFALLEAARAARPDAFIVFKPHPDVLSGNRRGMVDPLRARGLCDHIETGATLARCLDAADEIHTMTSLVGFEALLRDKRVVVYGQPFYAGWGLTEDRHPPPRRTRRLTLDQLVAGALLRYPRYLDRQRYCFTSAEATIDQLLAERQSAGDRRIEMTWLRRQLRKVLHAYKGLIHAP